MEPVEQEANHRSRGSTDRLSTTRRMKRSRVGFVVGSLGCALIVVRQMWSVIRGGAEWEDVEKNIGFVLVVFGWLWSQLALAQSERIAQSALSRLNHAFQCEKCGHDLAAEKCPTCGYSRESDRREDSRGTGEARIE